MPRLRQEIQMQVLEESNRGRTPDAHMGFPMLQEVRGKVAGD
jgi:hypothetical protein